MYIGLAYTLRVPIDNVHMPVSREDMAFSRALSRGLSMCCTPLQTALFFRWEAPLTPCLCSNLPMGKTDLHMCAVFVHTLLTADQLRSSGQSPVQQKPSTRSPTCLPLQSTQSCPPFLQLARRCQAVEPCITPCIRVYDIKLIQPSHCILIIV